jgi:hypothetical protein
MTQSLIEILQKRLDGAINNWRTTRTHTMGLIREAEVGIWEKALRLAKKYLGEEK